MTEQSLEDLSKAIEESPYERKGERFQKLIAASDDEWKKLSNARRLHLTGLLFNYADEFKEVKGLDRVLELNEQIKDQDLEPKLTSQWYYQMGNAHSARAHLTTEEQLKFNFFDSTDFIEAIGYKRGAVVQDDWDKLSKQRKSRAYVNLANILSETGRSCEALKLYNIALEVDSNFGMALGNRGQTKWEYSLILFNNHYKHMFLHSAYLDVQDALENSADMYPEAERTFQRILENLEDFQDESNGIEAEEEQSLGDTEAEIRYNKWVLRNRLFLNPLNDISVHTYAANDNFHLPTAVLEDKGPPYPEMYNQIKQEFVSARYMFYEGLSEDDNHFSDARLDLKHTHDSSVLGYRTEQIKTAL